MKLHLLHLLALLPLPLALAGGGDHGGRGRGGRDCPTETVEVCAEETKARFGKPVWATVTVPEHGAHCTGTTITEASSNSSETKLTPQLWTPTETVPCVPPTKTKEACVATQVVCEAHPKRAAPDAMSNAERLRRGLPIRAPPAHAARSFDDNGGRPDNEREHEREHPHGGAPGQNKDKDKDGHGKDKDKDRDGHGHGGGHGQASCTPATVTVTTSTRTHHVPTAHTLTRTHSTCEGGPTVTADDCATTTVDAPAVTETEACKRGVGFTAWVTHEYTQTSTEYGARCTPRVHRAPGGGEHGRN